MTTEQLAEYFDGKNLPEGPIKLNRYCTILDPVLFVEAQFLILHSNPWHKPNDSCLLRLIEFKEWLDSRGA
jgi:hypothetical protein